MRLFKMAKKTKEQEKEEKLAEAKRLLEEEEERQKQVIEQKEAVPVIDTTQETKAKEQPIPPEVEEKIKENVRYYQERYMGMFTQQDFILPGVVQCDLLFGILSELKALNSRLSELRK